MVVPLEFVAESEVEEVGNMEAVGVSLFLELSVPVWLVQVEVQGPTKKSTMMKNNLFSFYFYASFFIFYCHFYIN